VQVSAGEDEAARWEQLIARHRQSPLLWSQYFAFLSRQLSSSHTTAPADACARAATALIACAQQVAAGRTGTGAGAAHAGVWEAECAAVDALGRLNALQLELGHAAEAMSRLQACSEWLAFPAMVGVPPCLVLGLALLASWL
jgi:hypothetical protein